MIKEDNALTLEIVAGIGIFTGIAMVLALFIAPRPAVFAALMLGMVMSLGMFLSMAAVLKLCIRTQSKKFTAVFSVTSSMTRYMIMFAVLLVVIKRYSDVFDPIALVVGIFGVKAGAFLQPMIHRMINRKK
jgi:hypothetical protein